MRKRRFGKLARALATVAAVLAMSCPAQTQTFKVLFNFSSTTAGFNPYGALLVHDGVLYGTAAAGGGSNVSCQGEGQTCGLVFQFDLKSGIETVLHNFTGSPDGAAPYGGLFRDAAGNFYGTTYSGGDNNDGTVFRIDASGSESVLHSFTGADGYRPLAGVVGDVQGNLYGATLGTSIGSEQGTLFRLDPAGALKTITSPGAVIGSLRLNDHDLYGAESGGGAYNFGSIFRANMKSGTVITLRDFTGGADGGNPQGSLIADASGNLYGTATCGGTVACSGGDGVVFMLNPHTGVETVLHVFGGYPDGVQPQGQLALDSSGNLYGATAFGGGNVCNGGTIGCGTVFELTPPVTPGGAWGETILHNFDGGDGYGPLGGVVLDSQGRLYGVAFWGAQNNTGTLFEITP